MNPTQLLQHGALSAAQIAMLQGWKIDDGGAPLFVPDNALSAEDKQEAIAINAVLFQLAQAQLAAAGPGASINFGTPFVITMGAGGKTQ